MRDFQARLEKLLQMHRVRGVLWREEVELFFPLEAELEKALGRLEELGCKVEEGGNGEGLDFAVISRGEGTDEDAFQYYLSLMSHIPLLTREEEISLAEEMVSSRSSLRQGVLSSKLALNESIKILERVVSGELSMESIFELNLAAKSKRRVVLEEIERSLPLLRKISRQNTQDYNKILLGDFSKGEIQNLYYKMKERQKESVWILERFPLHLKQIFYWKDKLKQTYMRLIELSQSLEGVSLQERREVESQIRYYESKIWEPREKLKSRLDFLETEYRRYKQAKDRLTSGNLRLVISIAKRYRYKGMSFMDLVQEGNTGLMRAVEKFDPGVGCKFSTYATWWIRQSISRAIAEKARIIRLPIYMSDILLKAKHARAAFMQDYGRAPTVEELAEAVGISGEEMREIFKLSQSPLSLSSPVGRREEEGEIGDFLADEGSGAFLEEESQHVLREVLDQLLEILSPKEREVLQLRFGLNGRQVHTLEELGKKFNLTRERIRQIEQGALRKLKHPFYARQLECFLEAFE
ncbi:MAG: RNA polymerase sigma factor RpoD/SigA [Planctomycetota bacterium]|nr:MAG: RNA polymerase sigma factor RpoD/SigA [Planctomycetota bacterium]